MANDAVEQPTTPEAAPQGSPNLSSAAAANVAPEVDLPPTSETGEPDWSSMGGPSLEDIVGDLQPEPGQQTAAQPQVQTAAPQQPPAPVVQPAPQQVVAPTMQPQVPPQAAPQVPPVAYQPQVAQQPQAQAQEQPQAPPVPQTIPEVLQLFAQHAKPIEEAIAASEYALTQEDRDALETDAVAHIPRLLARAQLSTMKGTLHYVANFLPTMIQETVTSLVRQQQAEQGFLAAYPHLADPKLRNEIIRTGQALRSAYPQLPTNEFTKLVGQVMSMRYPAQAGAAQAQPGSQQRVQQIPFVPAVASQRAPIPQVPQAVAGDDWFNGMGGNYDDQQ